MPLQNSYIVNANAPFSAEIFQTQLEVPFPSLKSRFVGQIVNGTIIDLKFETL